MFEPSSDPPIEKPLQLLPRDQGPNVRRQGDPVRIAGGQRPTRSTRSPDCARFEGSSCASEQAQLMDGRRRGTGGSSAQCGCACGLLSRFPNSPLLGSMFRVLAPFWSRRHATLARILSPVPEPVPDSLPSLCTRISIRHPPPRHPPFRPSDKTILSSFPRSVFLLPSRDHPAIGRHCSSSKSSVPVQSWNSISISELQCLSLSAPPPRSPTSAHCHPFPASQLPPFHISKPTPSDRLQRDLYRTLELRNPRAKLHTSIHSTPSRDPSNS